MADGGGEGVDREAGIDAVAEQPGNEAVVGDARIAGAVAPHPIGLVGEPPADILQVLRRAGMVELGREDQARGLGAQPPATRERRGYHPAREVRPRHARERAVLARRQVGQRGRERPCLTGEKRRQDAELARHGHTRCWLRTRKSRTSAANAASSRLSSRASSSEWRSESSRAASTILVEASGYAQ